jgi:hypothetical protein
VGVYEVMVGVQHECKHCEEAHEHLHRECMHASWVTMH